MSLEDVLGKLNKATKDRIKLAESVTLERLPTPSIALNNALGGGFGYGRQSLIWGSKSSGKSGLMLQTIGQAQKAGKVCAWIDAESSYDKEWAARLGVDSHELILSPIKTVADMAEVGVDLMTAGVDVIVVDSISSLLPSSYFDKKDGLKDFSGTKQIGSSAKDLAAAVQMLNYANDHTALVLISQIRNQIGSYGAAQKPTGGFAVSFFSTTSLRLMSSARDDQQIKGTVMVGERPMEKPVGRSVNWLVDFNKIGPPNQVGSYDFYYDGDFVGVDPVAEMVDYGVSCGIISVAGSWHYLDDGKWQGRANMIKAAREDSSIIERINNGI